MEEARQRVDQLWSEGEFAEALRLGGELAEQLPADAAWREKLALMHIEYARQNPPQDQISSALMRLNQALEIEPGRASSLEVRANLYMLLAQQAIQAQLPQANFLLLLRHALNDFLRLLDMVPEDNKDRLDRMRLEAARASFMIEKNSPRDEADYRLSAKLFALVDGELLDPADWFFRGLANLETAQKNEDQTHYRVAAASFLRCIEEDAFPMEGRYFAADALLSLNEPTDTEYQQAIHLVRELDRLPSKDFLIATLKERLQLRAKLLGKEAPELGS